MVPLAWARSSAPRFWSLDGTPFDGRRAFDSRRPIIILDSGVGGLTVAAHVRQLIPNADLLYVADNEWFPYGNRRGTDVAGRVKALLQALSETVDPLATVIACNTASVAISDKDSGVDRRDCICISPPVAEAAAISSRKRIAVLATSSTLLNGKVRDSILGASNYARVWSIPAQGLVAMAEAKLAGKAVDVQRIAELLREHLTGNERCSIDTVVLGCTHFPHLVEELRQVFPSAINWVDPAFFVALELQSRVAAKVRHEDEPIRLTALTSDRNILEYGRIFSSNDRDKTTERQVHWQTASG